MKTSKTVQDEQKANSRAERIAAGRAIADRFEVRSAARTVRRVRTELVAARAQAESARNAPDGYIGRSWRKSRDAYNRSINQLDRITRADQWIARLMIEMQEANLKQQQRRREEANAKAKAKQAELDAASGRRRAREAAAAARVARGMDVSSKRTRADRIAAGRAVAAAFVKTIPHPERGSEMHKKLMSASLRISARMTNTDKKTYARAKRKSDLMRGLFYALHEEE